EGHVGRAERFSMTVEARMLYVTLPLARDGQLKAVLRQSRYLSQIEGLLARLRTSLWRAVLVMAVLALGAAAAFSFHLTGPIRQLVGAAQRVAGGDFTTRIHVRRRDEFRTLGESFNTMTLRLSESFADLTQRKEELANIVASIRDGLAVVDREGRLAVVNAAFKALAGPEAAEGRLHWEVVRSAGFQEIVDRARETRSPQRAEFRVGEKTVRGTACFLPRQDGVLVVLGDPAAPAVP
ncbi:MAG: HAMP domain-containing protein, partial [Candidatus Aminicenantes bacterium]|nr:HAMP domain-containing protein [Candidatus Aminicenantes bacterium]